MSIRTPKSAPPNPQRILIVRPSALGDVARTVPCLVSLRQAYPDAQIDWLAGSAFVDAVRAHPALSGVVPFYRNDTPAFATLLRQLRRNRFDLVIDLQGLARSGLMAWATRAKQRVGYANAREWGWLGLNHRHRIDVQLHAIERMLALVEAHGVPATCDLSLHVPPECATFSSDAADHPGLDPANPDGMVCLAPTAQWGCKCWPIQRYGKIAARLLEEKRTPSVMVISAPHEQEQVKALINEVPTALRHLVWFPKTTVGQMMDVIAAAKLVVCNDSAPLHLAVGLGTPTVSLFGPTDPALVGPPPDHLLSQAHDAHGPIPENKHRVLRAPSAEGQTFNYRAHRDDDTLISELSIDQVWSAVDDALQP